MNFLRNPWKPSHIQNPILTLANHPQTEIHSNTQDRYCLQSFPNTLAFPDNIEGVEENNDANSTLLPEKVEKKKHY